MTVCSVPRCGRPAVARGWCITHYKRDRAGKPLERDEPAVGSPDGHGQYGRLDEDETGLLCHECGGRYASLAAHVTRGHDMTAREYRLAHGLPLRRALMVESMRRARADRAAERVGSPAWKRLEAVRDPVAASAARDDVSLSYRGITLLEAGERARVAGRTTRVVYECVVCGGLWCLLPGGAARMTCSPECWRVWQATAPGTHRLRNASRDARIYALSRSGWTRREIAAEYGITTERVGQIVRDRRA